MIRLHSADTGTDHTRILSSICFRAHNRDVIANSIIMPERRGEILCCLQHKGVALKQLNNRANFLSLAPRCPMYMCVSFTRSDKTKSLSATDKKREGIIGIRFGWTRQARNECSFNQLLWRLQLRIHVRPRACVCLCVRRLAHRSVIGYLILLMCTRWWLDT